MSLPTTTFSKAVLFSDTEVYLTSTSGVIIGSRLAAGVEIFRVFGFGAGTITKVLRGQEGTASVTHASGDTVSIGVAVDFSSAPMTALIAGTTPDRVISVVVQDGLPTANTTSVPVVSNPV